MTQRTSKIYQNKSKKKGTLNKKKKASKLLLEDKWSNVVFPKVLDSEEQLVHKARKWELSIPKTKKLNLFSKIIKHHFKIISDRTHSEEENDKKDESKNGFIDLSITQEDINLLDELQNQESLENHQILSIEEKLLNNFKDEKKTLTKEESEGKSSNEKMDVEKTETIEKSNQENQDETKQVEKNEGEKKEQTNETKDLSIDTKVSISKEETNTTEVPKKSNETENKVKILESKLAELESKKSKLFMELKAVIEKEDLKKQKEKELEQQKQLEKEQLLQQEQQQQQKQQKLMNQYLPHGYNQTGNSIMSPLSSHSNPTSARRDYYGYSQDNYPYPPQPHSATIRSPSLSKYPYQHPPNPYKRKPSTERSSMTSSPSKDPETLPLSPFSSGANRNWNNRSDFNQQNMPAPSPNSATSNSSRHHYNQYNGYHPYHYNRNTSHQHYGNNHYGYNNSHGGHNNSYSKPNHSFQSSYNQYSRQPHHHGGYNYNRGKRY